MSKKYLSNAAYAKHRGVTKQYVGQMVKKGILSKTKDGLLDPAIADPIMDAYREPAKKTVSEKQPVALQETYAPVRRGISVAELPTLLLKTRIKSETEKAKLLEIKAKVEGGKYIDRHEAEAIIFKRLRPIRDNLLTIPDRLSAELTASQDRHNTHKILYNEIVRILDDATKPVLKKRS